MTTAEVWKQIPHVPGYEASSLGRIRNMDTGRIRACPPNTWGYRSFGGKVGGKTRTFTVHRCVLAAFRGLADRKTVSRHLNGDQKDNRIDNLVYGTQRENIADKVAHGTYRDGERHHNAKLTDAQVRIAQALYRPRSHDNNLTALGKRFGVTYPAIAYAIKVRYPKLAKGDE